MNTGKKKDYGNNGNNSKKAEVFIINFDISKQFRQMYHPKIN